MNESYIKISIQFGDPMKWGAEKKTADFRPKEIAIKFLHWFFEWLGRERSEEIVEWCFGRGEESSGGEEIVVEVEKRKRKGKDKN
jgi:hypothetical protein